MPKSKLQREANESNGPSLADRLHILGEILQSVAWELATLDDEVSRDKPDPDAPGRHSWRVAQAEDLLRRLDGSKLLNAEAFANIHGRLLDADHTELVMKGVPAADAKKQLRERYGYEMSDPTAVRNALTDVRRIRTGKAPLKPRTSRPSQPKPPQTG